MKHFCAAVMISTVQTSCLPRLGNVGIAGHSRTLLCVKSMSSYFTPSDRRNFAKQKEKEMNKLQKLAVPHITDRS
jgi:hypothetical protein